MLPARYFFTRATDQATRDAHHQAWQDHRRKRTIVDLETLARRAFNDHMRSLYAIRAYVPYQLLPSYRSMYLGTYALAYRAWNEEQQERVAWPSIRQAVALTPAETQEHLLIAYLEGSK